MEVKRLTVLEPFTACDGAVTGGREELNAGQKGVNSSKPAQGFTYYQEPCL